MDRGAWWVTVHGVAELDTNEQLTPSQIIRHQIPEVGDPCAIYVNNIVIESDFYFLFCVCPRSANNIQCYD